jgi:hypothetical protein
VWLIARGKSSWENDHVGIFKKFNKFFSGLYQKLRSLIIENKFNGFHPRFADLMSSI